MKPSLTDIFNGSQTTNSKPSLNEIFGNNATQSNPGEIQSSSQPFTLPGQETAKDFATNLATGEINTAKALYDRGKNLVSDTMAAGAQDAGKSLPEKVLGAISYAAPKAVETIAGGVGDIFTNMISPFIPQDIKDEASKRIVDTVNNVKTSLNEPVYTPDNSSVPNDLLHNQQFRDILKTGNDLSQKYPRIAQGFSALLDAVLLGEGKNVESAVKPVIETGAKTITDSAGNVIKNGIDTANNAIKQGADFVSTKIGKSEANTFANSVDEAKQILNPSGYYTPTEKAAALKKGNIEVKGIGPTRTEVVSPPTTKQTEAVAQLVTDGKISAKNPASTNIKVLQTEARATDSEIDSLVNRPDLNKPYTGAMINKVYDNVFNSAKKNLVFVPQTTEEKAYQTVIDVAKEEIAKQPKNMAGLRTGIKAFNARMEQILGSDIYSGASESVSNARVQAAKDVRTALNNFLGDNLESPTIKPNQKLANQKVVNTLPARSTYDLGKTQGGGLYKAKLQKEAQLLNAADEIAYRAGKNIDKNRLKIYLDSHPYIKKGLQLGGGLIVGHALLKEFGL